MLVPLNGREVTSYDDKPGLMDGHHFAKPEQKVPLGPYINILQPLLSAPIWKITIRN